MKLMRPLVRLAIGSGLTFPMLADLLRGLYVDVATNDLLPDRRTRTDSRVSLLTGVHRKELRRQRAPAPTAEPPTLTVASQVLARWLGTASTTTPEGQPLPIARFGAAPSFEALVSAVTRDIRPRALLDAWLDQGLATLDDAGRVRLEQSAYLPQNDSQSQLYYFARNLHDHIEAAVANVTAPVAPPPYLERAVHYDGLSAQAANAIATVARQIAETALLDVNRQALAIADADDHAAVQRFADLAPRHHRVNFGAFVLALEDPPNPDITPATRPDTASNGG